MIPDRILDRFWGELKDQAKRNVEQRMKALAGSSDGGLKSGY